MVDEDETENVYYFSSFWLNTKERKKKSIKKGKIIISAKQKHVYAGLHQGHV